MDNFFNLLWACFLIVFFTMLFGCVFEITVGDKTTQVGISCKQKKDT